MGERMLLGLRRAPEVHLSQHTVLVVWGHDAVDIVATSSPSTVDTTRHVVPRISFNAAAFSARSGDPDAVRPAETLILRLLARWLVRKVVVWHQFGWRRSWSTMGRGVDGDLGVRWRSAADATAAPSAGSWISK